MRNAVPFPYLQISLRKLHTRVAPDSLFQRFRHSEFQARSQHLSFNIAHSIYLGKKRQAITPLKCGETREQDCHNKICLRLGLGHISASTGITEKN